MECPLFTLPSDTDTCYEEIGCNQRMEWLKQLWKVYLLDLILDELNLYEDLLQGKQLKDLPILMDQ